jgi:hypothetical protein
MRWFAFLFAIGLAVQGCADGGDSSSFVRQCERRGLTQGTPAFEECIAKSETTVNRQHRAEGRWSP